MSQTRFFVARIGAYTADDAGLVGVHRVDRREDSEDAVLDALAEAVHKALDKLGVDVGGVAGRLLERCKG